MAFTYAGYHHEKHADFFHNSSWILTHDSEPQNKLVTYFNYTLKVTQNTEKYLQAFSSTFMTFVSFRQYTAST